MYVFINTYIQSSERHTHTQLTGVAPYLCACSKWPFSCDPSPFQYLRCPCYNTLQCDEVCCSVLQYVAVCCSTLQCVAVRCSVLQCVAYNICRYTCVFMCIPVKQALFTTCVARDAGVTVWYSMMQCVAVRCSALQRVAVCFGMFWYVTVRCSALHSTTYTILLLVLPILQCVAVCCNVLQCVAVCCTVLHTPYFYLYCPSCSVLQCVAVCCNVLQCVAVCCSVLQSTTYTIFLLVLPILQCDAVCCSVLQWVAVSCSVLQCVTLCCSVLQCLVVCCIQQKSIHMCIHVFSTANSRWTKQPINMNKSNNRFVPPDLLILAEWNHLYRLYFGLLVPTKQQNLHIFCSKHSEFLAQGDEDA